MTDVNELRLKGFNPTQISKQLGISRAKVLEYLEQWSDWAQNQQDVLRRAAESLDSVHEHYNIIKKELWEVVEEAKMNGELAIRSSTLKSLASIEKDHANLFQQAGLNDSAALAAELAERERREKIIEGVLRDIVLKCNHCRIEVSKRLSELNGRSEVIDVTPRQREITE